MGESRKPKIFISYSWDSEEHKERVKKFVDELNDYNKFEIDFDGYLKSTPTGGLKPWMQKKVQNVDLVLMICTKKYYDFFEDNIPPKKGKGVRWESKFIRDVVYNYNKDISQFFPIILKSEDYQYIPTVFSTDCHYYDLSKNETEKLKDALEDKFNEISGNGETIDIILDDLKEMLKQLVSIGELKLYATNLLNFSSIHLPDDFDSIVDHLYNHREPLLCLLKQLDDNRLAIILKKLQNELHISDSDLENSDCMKKNMKRKRCNLLITLEPENDNNEHISSFQESNSNTLEESNKINKVVTQLVDNNYEYKFQNNQKSTNQDSNRSLKKKSSDNRKQINRNNAGSTHKINKHKIAIDNDKDLEIKIEMVEVEIDGKNLEIGRYPVTLHEYDMFCENINEIEKKVKTFIQDDRNKLPLVNITLNDANNYCKWLSKKSNEIYRLPTSDEWKAIAKMDKPNNNFDDYICHKGNSTDIANIGSKKPGRLGLYDMFGYIEEMCSDNVTKGYSYLAKLDSILDLEKSKSIIPTKVVGFRIIKDNTQ